MMGKRKLANFRKLLKERIEQANHRSELTAGEANRLTSLKRLLTNEVRRKRAESLMTYTAITYAL